METSHKCGDQPLLYQVSIFELEFSRPFFVCLFCFFLLSVGSLMPLNKLGAVSTMGRGYPLGVFLGAFFGLGISRIHPNAEFVDMESIQQTKLVEESCA